MCADSIVWPLWLLFQKTFDSGIIPKKLKTSRVVPVFKKGDAKDIGNYRIIAISSIILKIFERAIKIGLSNIIEPLLSNAQHGFRARRSVTTNLLTLSIVAFDSFKNGHQLDIFYGDFERAFDRVWHRRLVEKLSRFGMGVKTAKWLCEFIVDRENYVKIGNATSRRYTSTSGVPAGSILGPILFLIYIDDIVDVIRYAMILLLADDVKIFKEVSSSLCTQRLQKDIDNIIVW